MIFPRLLDDIPHALGKLLARLARWSPVGRKVEIRVDDSDDEYLVARTLLGTVRAADPDLRNGVVLIHLQEPIYYESERVDMLVAAAAVRSHGPYRLIVTWSAVRLVDGRAFIELKGARMIGTGGMWLV